MKPWEVKEVAQYHVEWNFKNGPLVLSKLLAAMFTTKHPPDRLGRVKKEKLDVSGLEFTGKVTFLLLGTLACVCFLPPSTGG